MTKHLAVWLDQEQARISAMLNITSS